MSINKLDVVVVDYKTGNVDSVLKAISMANKTVELSDKKDVILSAKKIILPGQGSFDYVKKNSSFRNLFRNANTC